MECLTNKTIPNKTKITGNSGRIIVNGTNKTANNPENILNGRINTTDKIMENNKNMILNGMLKIYMLVENSLIKTTTPNVIKMIENISKDFSLYIICYRGSERAEIVYFKIIFLSDLLFLCGYYINGKIF